MRLQHIARTRSALVFRMTALYAELTEIAWTANKAVPAGSYILVLLCVCPADSHIDDSPLTSEKDSLRSADDSTAPHENLIFIALGYFYHCYSVQFYCRSPKFVAKHGVLELEILRVTILVE